MRRRYFQWIAGEDKGNITWLESMTEFDGNIYFNFDDGESCDEIFVAKMTDNVADLKDKFVVEIESPSNPWYFKTIEAKRYIDESMKGENIEIPTLHDILQAHGQTTEITNSDIGTQKLVPPQMRQRIVELPTIEEYGKKLPPPPQPVVQQPVVTVNNIDSDIPRIITKLSDRKVVEKKPTVVDPVKILVDSCKKHPTDINLNLSIDIPGKSIYAIAESEFENGGRKFIDYVVREIINVDDIIKQLKISLTEAYAGKSE